MKTKKPLSLSAVGYRLTLTQKAFALALTNNSGAAGKAAFKRPDGKWNVGITLSVLEQLKTAALPNENLSDTVVRILTPASEPLK